MEDTPILGHDREVLRDDPYFLDLGSNWIPFYVATIYQSYFKVLCIYILRMSVVNMNGKIKGNGVVTKLLFLVSVYEFPLLF